MSLVSGHFNHGVFGELECLSDGELSTSGEFVFVAVLAGYQSVAAVFVASLALELVRSFSNLYLPNTWQLVLGVFLLGVILFLPRGIGSLWIRERQRKRIGPPGAIPVAAQEEAAQ